MKYFTRLIVQAAAFLAGFLIIGLPYWSIPYHALNLPDALLTPKLIVVPLTALILRSFSVAGFWRSTLVCGAIVPAIVMTRVSLDCARDATQHNLWPFELIIALLLGFGTSLPAALLAKLIAFTFSPRKLSEPSASQKASS